MTVRFARLSRAVAASALLLAAPAVAQTDASDAGRFEVSVQGRPAGSEEFSIEQAGTGNNAEIQATSKVRLTLPSGSLVLDTRLRASGLDAQPVSYEASLGGTASRKLVGTLSGGRFSSRTFSAGGEQLREYVASSSAVVLDDHVAHHYYFVARRVRNGQIPVIMPRDNRQVMATVKTEGEGPLNVGGTNVNAYHLVIQPAGGDARHVWVDALGRVLKVEIPAQRYLAVRAAHTR